MIKHKHIKIELILPPITLSQKWHEIFKGRKNARLIWLEKRLNNALKLQGKLTNEHKEYGLLKKKLMADIITEMDGAFSNNEAAKQKDLEVKKRQIEQINDKLTKQELRLLGMPKEIKEANDALLKYSMALGYKEIKRKLRKGAKTERLILKYRKKLSELLGDQEEVKELRDGFYGFMHDMVGPELIEEFDRVYLRGKMLD